ncbi:MAG: hypothetical protein EBT86_03210 [Actinobacteria bacterium]|nr:hypothetical protein [Actinomycetota bacterium]
MLDRQFAVSMVPCEAVGKLDRQSDALMVPWEAVGKLDRQFAASVVLCEVLETPFVDLETPFV